jgi:hypothetical protein
MKLLSLILSLVFSVSLSSCHSWYSSANECVGITYSRDPNSILREVSKRGAAIIILELYNNTEAWQTVLRGIATGTEPWLKVAVALHPGSDAGSSEMLGLSVGEALENEPENVFRIALGEFQLGSVCSGPDVDDPRYDSYELAMAAIKRRQQRVAAISDPRIKISRNKCIEILEESKVGISRFYNSDNKSDRRRSNGNK